MKQKILLIEDDRELAIQVTKFLHKADFDTEWWSVGRAVTLADLQGFSLIILDLMLPGQYGLDILKTVRGCADIPVLILSARNDSADKVRALKLGADDYMTKPFWPAELVERVRARLRRPTMQKAGTLSVGPIQVDLERRAVTVQDRPVDLTRVEFDVLVALARRPDAAMSRKALADSVRDPDNEAMERTFDVHVSRLRKKLGLPNSIETVWGIGYRLRSEMLP